MPTSLVVSFIGIDKPGLVEALSETITSHEGNWLESRMSHLAGKFAGVLRVSVPDARAESLAQALAALEARGLKVLSEESPEAPAAPFSAVRLELLGTDRPGIVRQIAGALSRRGVNVEEFVTECSSAPMSGEALFRANARLRLPAGVALDDLRGELEDLAHSLMVDLSLAPDDTGDA